MTLQVILALVLIALGACLVPLLLQLRRTAAAVEELARSASRDLARVADDVHQIRVQTEEVAVLAKQALELPSVITQVISGVVRAIPSFFHSSTTRPGLFEILMGGIRTATAFFRRTGKGEAP